MDNLHLLNSALTVARIDDPRPRVWHQCRQGARHGSSGAARGRRRRRLCVGTSESRMAGVCSWATSDALRGGTEHGEGRRPR
ncbi:hypothetical protein PVAP13_5NG313573 [Panicum virgatum]|uniref:Uncharacterized protein n=1 Tax=Panicum virgatum TaxID=38727 RepID=A0A8T0RVS3_PANVG|nr:hypothetical protein PVAP13_5NG313573 [Panicum virgatum]